MIPLARTQDPITSHQAADRVEQFRCSHEARIYDALHNASGLTYREIAGITGMEPVAVARRLKAMERRSLIYRFNDRGGMAVWWKL